MGLPLAPPAGPTLGSARVIVCAKWALATGVLAVLAWLSFTRDGWVPFLSGVDLGIHEFGHLLFLWAPFLVMSAAGSGLQVAAPAALAGYFWWRRDRFAVVLMLGWLGMSLNNVAVYVFDATRMVLPLLGDDGSGAGHDWRNILGELGWLQHTDALAGLVRTASVAAFLSGVVLAAWSARRDLAPARSEWSLPVVPAAGPSGRALGGGWSAAPMGAWGGVRDEDQGHDREGDQERR